MKNLFFYLMISILFLNSCEKDFDPKIYGNLFTTNFPQTEADYEAYFMCGYLPLSGGYNYALSGWRHPFYSGRQGVIKYFDFTSDYCFPNSVSSWGGSWREWSRGDFANSVYFGVNFAQEEPNSFELVRVVTRMTNIIDVLQKASTLADDKKRAFVAEARLLRGIMMYYLLHIYGPVPVIVDPELVGNVEAEKNMTSRN